MQKYHFKIEVRHRGFVQTIPKYISLLNTFVSSYTCVTQVKNKPFIFETMLQKQPEFFHAVTCAYKKFLPKTL